jgi:GNAT superfamily N-acetyltransferase
VSFRVRLARAADVGTMERIWVDAGREAWAHILRPETLAGLAPPERLRESPEEGALVLVVERDGETVGFADARADAFGDAVVRAFYTHPSVWGLGAGRTLMEALLGRLRADGFPAARLWTAEANDRPRRFYERAGWRPDGRKRHESWHGSEFVEVGYRIELTSRDPA